MACHALDLLTARFFHAADARNVGIPDRLLPSPPFLIAKLEVLKPGVHLRIPRMMRLHATCSLRRQRRHDFCTALSKTILPAKFAFDSLTLLFTCSGNGSGRMRLLRLSLKLAVGCLLCLLLLPCPVSGLAEALVFSSRGHALGLQVPEFGLRPFAAAARGDVDADVGVLGPLLLASRPPLLPLTGVILILGLGGTLLELQLDPLGQAPQLSLVPHVRHVLKQRHPLVHQ
mmetsp:Transcript_115804/g.338677  ORF Transcript_115804/g.338677 Transcript_115804/m.338677 type:complete len:230 (+) Transcript_115804:685-1374(+)